MASRKNSKNHPARNLHEKPVQSMETKSACVEEKDFLTRCDPTRALLIECLERVTADAAGQFVENPAIQFTADVKAGRYDDLSDEEYNILLCRVEQLAALWNKQPRRPAGEILLAMLEQVTIPRDSLEGIADPLLEWYGWEEAPLDDHGNPLVFSGGEAEAGAAISAAFAPRKPAEIRDAIAGRVIGQDNAVKTAAMIVHGQLSGRRTNAVFAGPSGCGKSEIWRCLSREYPGLVRIIDFSRMCGEGWNGSVHLRDVFEGVANKDDIQRRGLIVVLDEADKVLCETAISSSGNNHNHVVQNNLLKMLDGDVIEFGAEHGQPAFSVDCSNVSVVMLGAFENLMESKSAGSAKHIGFGTAPESAPPEHRDISYDDLVKAGTRREIAGRINRIVALNRLDAGGYKAILEGPVLSDLAESFQRRIVISGSAVSALSEQAVTSGLGVRWAKSAMYNAIEDALFDAPDAEGFRLDMRGGELSCRAQVPRGTAPAEPCRAVSGGAPAPDGGFSFGDDENLPF